MKKKEYMKPSIEVVEINMNAQMLAGSVTSLAINGLDDDNLTLPTDDELTGIILNDAW